MQLKIMPKSACRYPRPCFYACTMDSQRANDHVSHTCFACALFQCDFRFYRQNTIHVNGSNWVLGQDGRAGPARSAVWATISTPSSASFQFVREKGSPPGEIVAKEALRFAKVTSLTKVGPDRNFCAGISIDSPPEEAVVAAVCSRACSPAICAAAEYTNSDG
jgi:hypothetical protein